MSLNQTEQKLYEYVLGHPEERQHWQDKVRRAASPLGVDAISRSQAAILADELWEYYLERRRALSSWQVDAVAGHGRISMRNLADLLLRVWGPSTPGKHE